MSPIGGQGMNTGFADAELAADTVLRWLRGASWEALCRRYVFRRRRAFLAAADRAGWGMWLGTRTGTAARLGAFFLRHVLLRPAVARCLAPHFAMQTIPYNRAEARESRP
jgi:2-polyprenyl-6-methoxyphenol hydroxylase-like FAD-dependent oxidoreductase